jgi:hypothetical protein
MLVMVRTDRVYLNEFHRRALLVNNQLTRGGLYCAADPISWRIAQFVGGCRGLGG